MAKYTNEELKNIFYEHQIWVESLHEEGVRAILRGADLRHLHLSEINLSGADLRDAKLKGVSLTGAKLRLADLRGADLRNVELSGADLSGADLRDADLRGANLPAKTYIIRGEMYFISITNGKYVRVECRNHTVEEWRGFSKSEITKMDGKSSIIFYPRLLDIIDFYIGKGEKPAWVS